MSSNAAYSAETGPQPAGSAPDFDAQLQALAREVTAASTPPEPVVPAAAPAVDLTPVLTELRRMAEVETANRQLFDTLHSELRQYRDGFLVEALHLPTIRDLLSLMDDLESIRCQVGALLPGRPGTTGRARGEVARALERAEENLENSVHFVREILQRLDVEPIGAGEGFFNRALHRQVGVEPAAAPEEEGRIASVVRSGFLWRSRILRPAEVIVRRVPAVSSPS